MNLSGHAIVERTTFPFAFMGEPDKSLLENVESWQAFVLETIIARLKADPNWLTITVEFDGTQ